MRVRLKPRKTLDVPIMVGDNVMVLITLKDEIVLYDITNNLTYFNLPTNPSQLEEYILQRYEGDVRILSSLDFIHEPSNTTIHIDGVVGVADTSNLINLSKDVDNVELVCYSINS